MFNEFENDPGDEASLNQNLLESLAALAGGSSNDSATKDSATAFVAGTQTPETVFNTTETMQSILEVLEGSRFYTDYIFYDISDSDGNSYDEKNLLTNEFDFSLKRITEVVNGQAALDPDVFTKGNVGIYKDTIEDKVATGGDIASGEYYVYSTVGKDSSSPPTLQTLSEQQFNLTDLSYEEFLFEDTSSDDYLITGVNYSFNEQQAFFLKYAAVPNTVSDNFDNPVDSYLNGLIDNAALDVYNTVITREYVPKLIKQETSAISSILNTSIGDEAAPLESTIFETTSTTTVEY